MAHWSYRITTLGTITVMDTIEYKTIILNQRKERDELLSRPYLIRRNSHDADLLLGTTIKATS